MMGASMGFREHNRGVKLHNGDFVLTAQVGKPLRSWAMTAEVKETRATTTAVSCILIDM